MGFCAGAGTEPHSLRLLASVALQALDPLLHRVNGEALDIG